MNTDSWKIRQNRKVSFILSEDCYGYVLSLIKYAKECRIQYDPDQIVMAHRALAEKDSFLGMIEREMGMAERVER